MGTARRGDHLALPWLRHGVSLFSRATVKKKKRKCLLDFKTTQRAMYITTKSRKPSFQQMRFYSPPSLTAFRQKE